MHKKVTGNASAQTNYTQKSCHSPFQLEQITPDIYLNNSLVNILGHTK